MVPAATGKLAWCPDTLGTRQGSVEKVTRSESYFLLLSHPGQLISLIHSINRPRALGVERTRPSLMVLFSANLMVFDSSTYHPRGLDQERVLKML